MTNKVYCPQCMFETIIHKGEKASDFYCPRHGVHCIESGEHSDLPWLG